jgi:hypothetical protein
MRSSTSDSKLTRGTYLLAFGCLAIALSVEIVTRIGFDRVSKIQRRIANEYRLATMIGADGHARKHVLVIGNSLLAEDVQFDRVREALGPGCDTRRLVIEQTGYLDWYYGLRRLFRDGARPDVVVLMLTARQSVATSIRGDFSAQYLIDRTDLPAATRELSLNPTATTNLLFSSVSKFWATRAEIRNYVLGRIVPDLGDLMHFSSEVDPRQLVDDDVAEIMRVRLMRLRAITDSYGARLVVVLPPISNVRDGSSGFLRAGSAVGVATLRPVASGTMPPRLYQGDGFHLNPTGAVEFTSRLIPALREELSRPDAPRAAVPALSAEQHGPVLPVGATVQARRN